MHLGSLPRSRDRQRTGLQAQRAGSAANNRPITVTDVQSDGRPRDVPGDSLSAQHLRAAAAAARLHRRRHGAEAVG
eukprot:1637025-Rhodomonas_salina.1